MKYTIGEAAKETGKSKATISKAIKNGVLSATRLGTTPTSPFSIEASELFRVFPKSSKLNTQQNSDEHPEKHLENNALEVEVKMLRDAVQVQKEIAEREREIANDLRRQLDQTMNLLAPPGKTGSFWQRLFGK